MVIVGAGGHGLATAYYLGRNHGITDVAVLEKGWLGGGNTGRNTTIIRSNYLQDASAAIYEKARGLYETLSQELNFNVMFSPRGVMMLAQTEHEVRGYRRTVQANALQETYKLEKPIKDKLAEELRKGDEGRINEARHLMNDWRKLTTSDHFYYMCTKYFADGDVHKYFNPYDSPYDSYINFMNVLDNVRARIER